MAYLWTKSIHLVFVMAWVATLFYLPRILVNLSEAAEAAEPDAVRTRLLLMGRRLYKFGHNMFGMAVLFGALLWFGHKAWPQHFPDVVAGRDVAELQIAAAELTRAREDDEHVARVVALAEDRHARREGLSLDEPLDRRSRLGRERLEHAH